jgi:hypothetical protein
VDALAAAEPVGAELHLRGRLLARDEQNLALGRHGAEGHEQKCRLADPGVAADQDQGGRHKPAAKHAV